MLKSMQAPAKSKIDSLETEKKLAINEAVNEKEREISEQKEKYLNKD